MIRHRELVVVNWEVSFFVFIEYRFLVERINRTRSAEGEAFFVQYYLTGTRIAGAGFSKARFRRVICGLLNHENAPANEEDVTLD